MPPDASKSSTRGVCCQIQAVGDVVSVFDVGHAGEAYNGVLPILVTGRPLVVPGMVTSPPEPAYPVMMTVPLLVA
jgi:hypothetical protein